MRNFSDYVAMREGLWLPDRRTTGVSRINPFPTTQAFRRRSAVKKFNPLRPVPAAKPRVRRSIGWPYKVPSHWRPFG